MSRRLWIILGSVLVVGAGAVVVWRLVLRDTTTPVTAPEVIEEVSERSPQEASPAPDPMSSAAAATTTGSTPPTTPPAATVTTGARARFIVGDAPGDPGLYVYETSGFEEIDALGGARHDYPADTFVTLQPGGCGLLSRWTALEERWGESELCPSEDGFRLAGFESYHEWFGRSDLQDFGCDPDTALVVPTDGTPRTWSYVCSTDERTERWDVEVVGVETLTVAGEEVHAVHVRVKSALEGASRGTSTTETWYLQGTALIVRRIAERSSVNESLIGDVHYEESFEISLKSLEPAGSASGS